MSRKKYIQTRLLRKLRFLAEEEGRKRGVITKGKPKEKLCSLVSILSGGNVISKDHAYAWIERNLLGNSGARLTGRLPEWTPPKKFTGPDFYRSPEWRQVRYQVLKSASGRCCLCGRSGGDGAVLHVDHIKPRSVNPELELDQSNLQVLCEDCNLGKVNYDATDWRNPPET